jgi:hypothetical protein
MLKAFIQFSENHLIIALYLSPHTTHILQPLDASVFAPLTKAYKKRMYDYNMYSTLNINKFTFLELLYEATKEINIQLQYCQYFSKDRFIPIQFVYCTRKATITTYYPFEYHYYN